MNSVNIYIEANPNPNSLKFVTDRMLLQNNEIKDYPDPKSAIESPIALALFEFKYIEFFFILVLFLRNLNEGIKDTFDFFQPKILVKHFSWSFPFKIILSGLLYLNIKFDE